MSKRIGFLSFVFLVMFSLSGLIAEGSSKSDASSAREASDIAIAHIYGETVLSSVPEKVVSVGWSEHETVLALGVVPVAVRDYWNHNDMPFATGSWVPDMVREKLMAAEPVVLSNELDFEAIAALAPDVIVGVTSNMTEEEYNILAQIAPTIAQSGEYVNFGTPWQVVTRILGEVLGKTDEAEQVISGIHNRMDGIKARHPEFVGASAAVAFVYSNQLGTFTSQAPESRLLQQLGFVIPPEYDEMADNSHVVFLSDERLDLLDTGVIISVGVSDEALQDIRDFPLRDTLTASAEGREFFMDKIYTRAFGYSSPSSIAFLLDILESGLAAALDGDPATLVPESLR